MQMYYATSFYSCTSPLKTSSFFSFYSYYSGSILRVSGFPSSLAIWLSCIPFTVNFLCTFIGIYAVEKAGRRVLTLLSFIGRFLRGIRVYVSFIEFTLRYSILWVSFLVTLFRIHHLNVMLILVWHLRIQQIISIPKKNTGLFSTENHSGYYLSNYWIKLFSYRYIQYVCIM